MYNNPYFNYNSQLNLEKIDKQIADLEKLKSQMQQPAPITQNFQLAPSKEMRYANSIDEVIKEPVYGDTPFFSKDMSILWVKNGSNNVKTYELKEIIAKDEKDVKIEFLQAQIEELKKGMSNNAKSNDEYAYEPIESEKSTNVSNGRTSKKKSE